MMNLKALLMCGVFAIAGCTSPQTVNQHSQASSALTQVSDLEFSEMRLPGSLRINIDDDTQILNSGAINSPVAAFKLPADRGKLEIDITSEIQDSVFSPLVMIMDEDGNLLEEYDAGVFEYRKPRLILGDRLVAEIDFYPPVGHKYVDMIIYTSEEELAKETMVMHPGRAMAEAKGNYMPELKDIAKPHTKSGRLVVEVSGHNYVIVQERKERYPTAKKPVVDKPETETTDYYLDAITKAVNSDNIPKALSLLDEAKSLNVEGAQEAFVKAVNSKR